MTTLSATTARTKLPEALNRVAFGHERVLIERHGRSVAALISMDDLELLQELEAILDGKDARKALGEIKSGTKKVVTLKAMRRKLGL